jgi:hypothetical protein
MNRIWLRALLVSFFTASSIAVANAQQTPPADEQQKVEEPEKKAEETPQEDPTKKKTEEEKKDEQPAGEQPKADQPAVEQTPAEEPKPAEQPEPAEQPAEAPKVADEPKAETPAAADTPATKEVAPPPAAPAAAVDNSSATPLAVSTETKPSVTKDWKVSATAGLSVGAAFLNANSPQRSPSVGWSLDAIGSYRLLKVLDGNLDAFLRITMDQVLANTLVDSAVGQTKQYEFFFRDVRLGVTAPNFYKEQVTGITASASTEFFLPTSKTTIAAERWLRWGLNARLGRVFEKLGPGDLSLGLGSVFRKDFSNRQVNPDQDSLSAGICRVTNIKDGDCIGSQRNSNFTFINDVAIGYTWGPVSLSLSFAIYSIRYYRQDLGEDPAGLEVRESPYASNNTWSNLTLAAVGASYTITENFSVGLDITTYQSPYIYNGTSNSSLRFPFFDTASNAENLTTFDLSAAFTY